MAEAQYSLPPPKSPRKRLTSIPGPEELDLPIQFLQVEWKGQKDDLLGFLQEHEQRVINIQVTTLWAMMCRFGNTVLRLVDDGVAPGMREAVLSYERYAGDYIPLLDQVSPQECRRLPQVQATLHRT